MVAVWIAAAAAMSAVAVLALRAARLHGSSSTKILSVATGIAAVALGSLAFGNETLALVGGSLMLGAILVSLVAVIRAGHLSSALATGEHRSLLTGGLQDRERRFRKLVEQAWDAILLLDGEGRIRFASASVGRILGYEPDEITNRPLLSIVHSEDARNVRAGLDEMLGQPGHRVVQEFRAQHKNGGTRWLEGACTNLLDDHTIRSVVANLRDVTERMQAEEALRRSEGRYRSLVEHATAGIYRSDPKGRFLSVNSAMVRLLGYENEEELLAIDVTSGVYVDPNQRRTLIEQYRNASEIKGVEVEWRRKDGSRVLVWLSGRPIRDEDEELVAFEMMAEDVTERRSLEAQLRQAQKMEAIGQLAGGIAHDFNNMLTVILANTDIIETTLGDGGRSLREELTDLRRAAQQGRDLVKKLLGYGRRDMLEVRPVNIARFVEGVLPTLKRVLPESIEVRFASRITEPVVAADVGAIQQILFNLATNSRDAMPKGGTIQIEVGGVRSGLHPGLERWGARGEFVRLAVSDTGHGMEEETRARVFDPFFTTKPAGVGTGLGMSMIYGLVKQQNGFILVDSTIGKGTTVEIFLPLVAASVERKDESLDGGSPAVGSETILVVEDEGSIRRSVKRLLERMGYRVLLAKDGVEALEVFDRGEVMVDLVVSDVVMPRMGGFELFDALRERGIGTQFLFASGYATPDIKHRAREESQAFLQKPWDVDDFLRMIRELLDAGHGSVVGGDSTARSSQS